MFLCFCNCFCAAFGRNDLTCAIQFCLGALSGLLLPNEVVRNMNIYIIYIYNIYIYICLALSYVYEFDMIYTTLQYIAHHLSLSRRHSKAFQENVTFPFLSAQPGAQAVAFAKGTPQ